MRTIIVGCSNSVSLARSIATHAKKPFSQLNVKVFPDGELYLRFMTSLKGKHVVLVQSMHPNPSRSMIEAIFATRTAKELGAKKVTLVAPYLGYMRQDKRFRNGECKSNTIMARLLSVADKIVTVDPHLHRIHELKEIFKKPSKTLTASKSIGEWIKNRYKDAIIIGPDGESLQWASKIGEYSGFSFIVFKKKRYNARVVRIKVTSPELIKGKNVILVDDIISSGNTMIEPIKQLKKYKAKSITCIGVHGIFADNALKKLERLGAKVYSTNAIPTRVSKIDLAPLIITAL